MFHTDYKSMTLPALLREYTAVLSDLKAAREALLILKQNEAANDEICHIEEEVTFMFEAIDAIQSRLAFELSKPQV